MVRNKGLVIGLLVILGGVGYVVLKPSKKSNSKVAGSSGKNTSSSSYENDSEDHAGAANSGVRLKTKDGRPESMSHPVDGSGSNEGNSSGANSEVVNVPNVASSGEPRTNASGTDALNSGTTNSATSINSNSPSAGATVPRSKTFENAGRDPYQGMGNSFSGSSGSTANPTTRKTPDDGRAGTGQGQEGYQGSVAAGGRVNSNMNQAGGIEKSSMIERAPTNKTGGAALAPHMVPSQASSRETSGRPQELAAVSPQISNQAPIQAPKEVPKVRPNFPGIEQPNQGSLLVSEIRHRQGEGEDYITVTLIQWDTKKEVKGKVWVIAEYVQRGTPGIMFMPSHNELKVAADGKPKFPDNGVDFAVREKVEKKLTVRRPGFEGEELVAIRVGVVHPEDNTTYIARSTMKQIRKKSGTKRATVNE